ncbi:MAG: hypothetical protein J5J06_14110 [Phycisphaerae bacterium]|nr:hypothetical protein [Phycisphaerae bacterium]
MPRIPTDSAASAAGNVNTRDGASATNKERSALRSTPEIESGSHEGNEADRASGHTDLPVARRGRLGRWVAAVVIGAVVGTPLAWLLSHAAFLPFFLGLFFFALFGLVVGALMHRIAAAGRPYAAMPIVLGTTVVVLWMWGFSIYKESRDFPVQRAEETMEDRRLDLGDHTPASYRAMVRENVQSYLRQAYAPGGFLGYVRFVVRDGVLPKGTVEGIPRTQRAAHRGGVWLLRAGLSIGLLAFGVASQTNLLRLKRDPAVRKIDEAKAEAAAERGSSPGET